MLEREAEKDKESASTSSMHSWIKRNTDIIIQLLIEMKDRQIRADSRPNIFEIEDSSVFASSSLNALILIGLNSCCLTYLICLFYFK